MRLDILVVSLALIIVVFLIVLFGKAPSSAQSQEQGAYGVICVDSVEYILYREGPAGYMSPHFRADGTLFTCEN